MERAGVVELVATLKGAVAVTLVTVPPVAPLTAEQLRVEPL